MKQLMPMTKYIKLVSEVDFDIYNKELNVINTYPAGEYVLEAEQFRTEIVYVDDAVVITNTDQKIMTNQQLSVMYQKMDLLITRMSETILEIATQGGGERTEMNNNSILLESLHTVLADYVEVNQLKLDYLNQSLLTTDSPTFAGATIGSKNVNTYLAYLNQSLLDTDDVSSINWRKMDFKEF